LFYNPREIQETFICYKVDRDSCKEKFLVRRLAKTDAHVGHVQRFENATDAHPLQVDQPTRVAQLVHSDVRVRLDDFQLLVARQRLVHLFLPDSNGPPDAATLTPV
jgi:hypothetical protein